MDIFMSSPSTVTHKSLSVETRQNLLALLEREGQITRTRMAECLSVSRMTADRLVDQLLFLGLVSECHGNDPHTGRKSHLVTLAPTPPCLLLEVDEDKPYMTAYSYGDECVRGFHAEYRFMYSRIGNARHLRDMARALWRFPDHVPCLLLQPSGTDDRRLLEESGLVGVDEADAIAAYLSGQPSLSTYRSLLHLRMGVWLFATLYVRHPREDLWFSPTEPQIFNLPDMEERADESDDTSTLLSYLSAYPSCFSADTILMEKSSAQLSDFAPFSADLPDPEPSFREISVWRADGHSGTNEPERICRSPADIPLLRCESTLPLWIYGALKLQRRRLWMQEPDDLIPAAVTPHTLK